MVKMILMTSAVVDGFRTLKAIRYFAYTIFSCVNFHVHITCYTDLNTNTI